MQITKDNRLILSNSEENVLVILCSEAAKSSHVFIGSKKRSASSPDRDGIIMIANETITGFRFSAGNAQKHYGFVLKLTILGKAIMDGIV